MNDVALNYVVSRIVTSDYATALRRVAASMAGAGVTPLTITDSSFTRWMAGLPCSPTTRSNYRRMGLTLWRHAIDTGMTKEIIGRIPKVKAPLAPPVAWSMDELANLLDSASKLTCRFKRSHCPASIFFRAWVLLGYETGLRFSDLLGLLSSAKRGGRLHAIVNKTGRPIGKTLSPECSSAVDALIELGDGRTIFRWAIAERRLRVYFAMLCRDAGVCGTPKFLRRSGATHCEKARPGSAQSFLGHLSPGLAQKHYVDPTLIEELCPSPPSIVSAG